MDLRVAVGEGDVEALLRACDERNEEEVARLLQEHVYAEDALRLAMQKACTQNNTQCLRSLLRHEPRLLLNRAVHDDVATVSPLELCVDNQAVACARILVEAGAANTHEAEDVLPTACYRGGTDIVDQLLSAGVNIDAVARQGACEGWTALHCAVNANNSDLTRTLLTHGADVNCTLDVPGWAGDGGSHRARTALARLGVQMDTIGSKRHMTPLHLAVCNRNAAMSKLLLQSGADVNARDSVGRTPLYLCCVQGQHPSIREIIDTLLQHGADLHLKANNQSVLDMKGKWKRTVNAFYAATNRLAKAVMKGDLWRAEKLLKTDPRQGSYAFHHVCTHGTLEAVRWFADKAINVNITVKGKTALHAAIAAHDLAKVQWLLTDMSADASLLVSQAKLSSRPQMDALALAIAQKQEAIAHTLLDHGAAISFEPQPKHADALFRACRAGLGSLAWRLLQLGAPIPDDDAIGSLLASCA
ncbi:hypothetical protein PTSG_06957 [Salpingoeca rosetta]|uniref:Uncharacterized protein n=1 Tax=Salpingoeca rosetta (strain ATCC 50818 / BSB-021) TaxID=946362 RepID=F2UFA7_SALR5|nr:uncharacterized protein PTSG_06957 [Salpingoeca rosetta]EGD75307.1 hypothetical protein PTSG_06957 [Salpingoeca rosetta]|eukprot:XP_004992360.1 hypothetical protein PTSG_06957 [Salpingoeca rosetta]